MEKRFTESRVVLPFRGAPAVISTPRKDCRQTATNPMVLVISEDSFFVERLCRSGTKQGLMTVRVDNSDHALEQLRVAHPIAVLLDLDLPREAAWAIAERLLQDETCPQLVLVTARVRHFDFEAASQAGSVIDKSANPSWLFNVLARRAIEPSSAQAARNAIQRVLIRWLRPCERPIPAMRLHRWWGINE